MDLGPWLVHFWKNEKGTKRVMSLTSLWCLLSVVVWCVLDTDMPCAPKLRSYLCSKLKKLLEYRRKINCGLDKWRLPPKKAPKMVVRKRVQQCFLNWHSIKVGNRWCFKPDHQPTNDIICTWLAHLWRQLAIREKGVVISNIIIELSLTLIT